MLTPIQFDSVSDIYDYYVTSELDIPFFMKETEGFTREILELMCGTGRVSIPLLQANRKLVCVDYSRGMLDSFRKKIEGKNYPVELIKADVTTLNLGRTFECILLPFHSFSEILTPELQQRALAMIAKHLEPNGIFVCTLQNPAMKFKAADGVTKTLGKFPMEGGKTLVVSYMNEPASDGNVITGFQQYEIFDSSNALIEKRRLEINFMPVGKTEFEKMVQQAGMEVEALYGDYSYSRFVERESVFMIYRLKKG
ncbi:MAG: class I SAM-dependent methyltransferase [Bacteroidetes bacterium]|nr:MAG: class I SAM-dependent methyltransferase [Bacteroidota bacterium]